MTPRVLTTMKKMIAKGVDVADTHWFDISDAARDTVVPANWLRDYRPPFERCVVVFQGPMRDGRLHEVIMSVSGTDPEEGITVGMYRGAQGESARSLPLMDYAVDGDQLRYGALYDDKPVARPDAEFMLYMVASWYQSLSLGTQAYIPEVRDTFTNRRKIKQGKTPLYDWRTVVITPCKPQPASQHKGGTHASPRQHDRRGHLRHLRNGKNVWVRPCKVGDPSKGAVFHDYEVRAA